MHMAKPLLVSDICIPSVWIPFSEMGPTVTRVFKGRAFVLTWVNKLDSYRAWKGVYRGHGVWTWDRPPVREWRILEL
jgi:hypothetical protein